MPNLVRGKASHDERQRAVQAARNTHDEALAARPLDARDKPLRLHGENARASYAALIFVLGNERRVGNISVVKARHLGLYVEQDFFKRRGGKSIFPHSLPGDLFHVDFRGYLFRSVEKRAAFFEYPAALGDDLTSAVDRVRGGFAAARAAIDIDAFELSRLRLNECAAIIALADHLVARRKIQDDVRSARGELLRGRGRRPEIFAYLAGEGKLAHPSATADDVSHGETRDRLTVAKRRFARHAVEGSEIARLVKFSVSRDIALGIGGYHSSAVQDKGAVIELASAPERRADDDRRVQPARKFGEREHSLVARLEQLFLQKEVSRRIARDPQFGKDDERRALRRRVFRRFCRPFRVRGGIRHDHLGRYRAYFDKSVFHISRSFALLCAKSLVKCVRILYNTT